MTAIWNSVRRYLGHFAVGYLVVPAGLLFGSVIVATAVQMASQAVGLAYPRAVFAPLDLGLSEPYFALPILVALYLGYRLNRDGGRLASWIWVPALLWLGYDIWSWREMALSLASGPNGMPGYGSWSNVLANFFGHACGGCGNEWFDTAPFYTSVAYSLGAWVRRRRMLRPAKSGGETGALSTGGAAPPATGPMTPGAAAAATPPIPAQATPETREGEEGDGGAAGRDADPYLAWLPAARRFLGHLAVGWLLVPVGCVVGSFAVLLAVAAVQMAVGVKRFPAMAYQLQHWALEGPYFILPVLVAVYFGYRLNRNGGRLASWIWVPALLWLAFVVGHWLQLPAVGAHGTFPAYPQGSWANVWRGLFVGYPGPGERAVYPSVATAPLFAAVAYSIGAWARRRRMRPRAATAGPGL